MKTSALIISSLMPYLAWGADCDCQKIVGSCRGSIEFVKSFGSTPSYGAEIIVHSSERTCLKVEYYLDGTPHQTVLVNKRSEPESLFGTNPITAANISFSSCKICSTEALPKADTPSTPGMSEKFDLTGTWSSVQTCSYGSGSSTMKIQHDGSSGSIDGYLSNGQIDTGKIQGSEIAISATAGLFRNNHVEMRGKVISPTRITGTYTQTAVAGTCSWEAIKQ